MNDKPKLVIIESRFNPGPLAWPNREVWRKRHIEYAILCMRDSLSRGECPFASHLLYTHPGLLNDDVPEERARGIAAGLAWAQHADLTAVYDDYPISEGMRRGIQNALDAGRPIVYRYIGLLPADLT